MNDQIVLIVGAGASRALHPQFALGDELFKQISDRVIDRNTPNELNLSQLLNDLGFGVDIRNKFVSALDRYKADVRDASIDAFVDEVSSYPEFQDVKEDFIKIAKFSIVFHILGYEGELKRSIVNELEKNAWINEVAEFINRNNLLENSNSTCGIKIITFNYDRNLEHFLYNHELFADKKSQISTFIDNSIYHVYGKIGDLNWQNEEENFEFGEDNNKADKIFKHKNAIGLMYMERLDKNIDDDRIEKWIHSSETKSVCAFGFNFDLINYRLLSLQNLASNKYGRGKLIANVYPSDSQNFNDRRLMANKVRSIKHDSEIIYSSCSGFLKDVLNR